MKQSNSIRTKMLIALFIIAGSGLSFGQNIQDALRMSQQQYFSSARSAGVGSAYGAIGADFGSVSYNPAGVAAFRTSEFTFGFSMNNVNSNAQLKGSDVLVKTNTNQKLKLENVGIVIFDEPGGDKWVNSNFAFGLNRTANFDQKVKFNGQTKGSFTDRFLERANGKDLNGLDNFEGGLAYDVGAIYGPDNQLDYVSDYQKTPNNLLKKSQNIHSRGGIYEMVFAYGASFQDKLLFGLSVGIPFINYTEEKSYLEESIDANSVLKKLEYDQYLSTSGVGMNFKAGLIGRLSQNLRVGVSVHSPSYYTLQDDYYNEMLYEYYEDGLQSNLDGSPDGYFKYKFKSPWRYTGSIGGIFSIGELNVFIDADAEYADYASSKFNFTAYSTAAGDEMNEKDQNENIREQLESAITLRLGGELAYDKYRLRMGYVAPQSPFGRDEINDVMPSYTLGLGFREWKYYIDLAFVKETTTYGYSPYELIDLFYKRFVKK
jgi:long-subunit fatty acid transport protein